VEVGPGRLIAVPFHYSVDRPVGNVNLRLAGNDYFKIMAVFERYNLVTEEELKNIQWERNHVPEGIMDTYVDTKNGRPSAFKITSNLSEKPNDFNPYRSRSIRIDPFWSRMCTRKNLVDYYRAVFGGRART
jgi:hypothetical protein